MRRRNLDAILDALADGEIGDAVARLVELECDAFDHGSNLAGEFAYARWRAEAGDVVGAADVVRQLAEGRR